MATKKANGSGYIRKRADGRWEGVYCNGYNPKTGKGSKHEYPLFVAVFTGLRQGELLGLTWDCVDFEHGLLLINKQHNRVKGDTEFRFASLKNDKARVLTVADEVMEVLMLQKQR